MPGFSVKVLLQDIKKLETEALIVGFYENVRPLKDLAGQLDWLLCGSLSNLIIRHTLQGTAGDVALLTSRGKVPARKIFMVGLGRRDLLTASSLKQAAKNAIASAISAGVKNAAIECFHVSGMSYDKSVPALCQGMSEAARKGQIDIALLAPDPAAYEKISTLLKGLICLRPGSLSSGETKTAKGAHQENANT